MNAQIFTKKTIIGSALTLLLLLAVPLTISTLTSRTELQQQANTLDEDDIAIENIVASNEQIYANTPDNQKHLYKNVDKALTRYKVCRKNNRPKKCWKNIEDILPPGLKNKLQPTVTPAPTEIVPNDITQAPSQGSTGTLINASFKVSLCPQSIGNCGVANHDPGNLTPRHPSRTVSVQVVNSANQVIKSVDTVVSYNTSQARFIGDVTISQIPTGSYTIKVKMPKYLVAIIPGIQNLSSSTQISLAPGILTPGDVNNDNIVNTTDFNMLMKCFSDLQSSTCAPEQIAQVDLDDDGLVNSIDYNLFIRVVGNIQGN